MAAIGTSRSLICSTFIFILLVQVWSQTPPVQEASEKSGEGIWFGNSHYARQEFTRNAGFLDSILDDSVVSLEFQTIGSSGVLFYIGGMTPRTDHLGLFMKDGKLTYVFDNGLGAAVMTTENTYNDGKWHQVTFSRRVREGRLVVDDKEDVKGTSVGTHTRVDAKYPFYVGGLSEAAAHEYKIFLKGVVLSFPGCIRNLEVQGELWTAQKQTAAWNTSSCSSTVNKGKVCSDNGECYPLNCECSDHTLGCKFQESGIKKCLCVFGYEDQGGKCKGKSRPPLSKESVMSMRYGSSPYSRREFTFDTKFLDSTLDESSFSLEFKTSGESGVILYADGKAPHRDYMGLFMQDGRVKFMFDCGSGAAVMISQNTYNDGEWHQVVFSRQGRDGRLVIDDKEEVLGTSPGDDHKLNIKHPFYVGGLSKEEANDFKNQLKEVHLSFPGCIRYMEGQGEFFTVDYLSREYKRNYCVSKLEGGNYFYSDGGYLVLNCKCGEDSTGCRFTEDGKKECLCSQGYEDIGGICAKKNVDVPHSEQDYSGQCALPLYPRLDTVADPEGGIQFGNTPNSRQEFDVEIDFMKDILIDSVFSLDFKTTGDSGVLFYVGGGPENPDFVALYMKRGNIYFVYDFATGPAVLISRNRYNDGEWHHVSFWRHGKEGRLDIDGIEVKQDVSPGIAYRLDAKSPFYVGGLPEEKAKHYAKHMRGIATSFPGCIRNFEAKDVSFKPGVQRGGSWNTTTCSRTEERGTFFPAEGGYLVLVEKFRVGQELSFSMDIKPRNLSGVLLAVHGRRDYLVLQLVEGRVELTVDNGDGPMTATYTPGDKNNSLCDGRFHTIRIATHSNSTITLSVDDEVSENGMSVSRISSTDTFDPLYVGGLPNSTLPRKGVKTSDQYVGCVRNVVLNENPQVMANAKPFGQVIFSTCPTI